MIREDVNRCLGIGFKQPNTEVERTSETVKFTESTTHRIAVVRPITPHPITMIGLFDDILYLRKAFAASPVLA